MSIILGLWLLGITLAVAMLVASTKIHRFERLFSEAAAGLLLAVLPFVFIGFTDMPFLILAGITHLWLLMLPVRLLFGRLERLFLLRSTRANALAGFTVIVCTVFVQFWRPTGIAEAVIAAWLAISVSAGIFIFGQLWWNTRRYYIKAPTELLQLKQLPTVSVCIPARNEDHALTECLASVLASTYSKLEVLVLDDCSQDSTSAIIRSFAHDGVRFIQGENPADGWLGKNQALNTLAQHASGEYLLFLDVDTHVTPQSITNLVHYALQEGLEMVSILPQNRLGITAATTFNTLDYYWRQILPVRNKHVPVSSKAWLITASSLRHLGGFASASRKIVPEESFASRLALRLVYRFVISNPQLGITTAKRWTSQIETAIRTSYPRLGRQPMAVLAACLALLGLFLAPFVALAAGALLGNYGAVWWIGLAAAILLLVDYGVVLLRVQPKSWYVAIFFWPVTVVQEFALFITSMLQYEFGEVNWKGRNVCYPVLAPGRPRFSPELWRRQ